MLLGHSYGGFLAQLYTVTYPEAVAGLVLLGAAPGMWTVLGPSHQGEFLASEERVRMEEIRRQLQQLHEERGWTRRQFLQLLVYNNFAKHDQYGLRYSLSPFAAERTATPFERVENRDPG